MKIVLTLLLLICTAFGFSQSGTLIVLNKSDDTADLIDLGTGQSIATLPTGDGPHEVAVSPDGRYAVVTNYGRASWPGSSLSIIDIAHKKYLKSLVWIAKRLMVSNLSVMTRFWSPVKKVKNWSR